MKEKNVIFLNAEMVTDRDELYRYLRGQLELPEYCGDNLDALYDVLTDITEETLIILENSILFDERMGWYGRQLLRVFRDAAEDNCYLTAEIR